jgi:aryl-alcohol dehydrogenase-like predicted oxidoreductase
VASLSAVTPSLAPWCVPRSSPGAPALLALGTMNFGKRTPEADARRIIDRALDQGVVLLDTANAYVDGESERIVGRALRGRRDAALVATKVGLLRFGGELSGLIRVGGRAEGLSRARILQACDESLERLGTEYIDVYYLHAPDRETPIEESLSGVAELLRAGKIRGWAVSNFASWQVLEMLGWCDREGMARPIMAQQMYNLLVRQLDVEYLAFAAKYRLATTVYNPLAGGLLAGRHAPGEPPAGSRFDANPMYQRRYWTERLHAQVEDYRALAAALGMSLVTLAYAWLASRPGVDSILVGPGTVAHLDDALAATALRLDAETLRRIDDLHRTHQGTDATYARL